MKKKTTLPKTVIVHPIFEPDEELMYFDRPNGDERVMLSPHGCLLLVSTVQITRKQARAIARVRFKHCRSHAKLLVRTLDVATRDWERRYPARLKIARQRWGEL